MWCGPLRGWAGVGGACRHHEMGGGAGEGSPESERVGAQRLLLVDAPACRRGVAAKGG